MIGAELMARAIERQGVKTIFGLPGHLESFFGALLGRKIRLINVRHEASCVLGADGYARAKRGIGVACVTAGPGFANAIGGLATTYTANSPVLIFAGRNPIETKDTGVHQEMDHQAAARPIIKWSATVYDASRLGEYIDMACRIALSGRPGPVLLDVPRDVSQAEVYGPVAEESLKPLVRGERPHADPAAIKRAAEMLAGAERPLIVAGNGAYWGLAEAGLRRLARDHGIPVFAKALGRGLVPEDDEIGFSWAVGHLAAREADVVLVAGARMAHAIGFAAPPLFREDARYIQIDIDGGEIGRNRYVEAPVVGDCGLAVEAIADEMTRHHHQPHDPTWVRDALKERLARIDAIGREEKGQVHPIRMARELASRMPENAIFIGDGANCLNWCKAIIRVHASTGWMDQEPFGSMGVGLPIALGVVAAEQERESPRPVFLGTGDGALGQYLGELATASLHGLSLFIMVANDGGWGASRNITLGLFGATYGVEMNQSRYDLVAQGLECHGEIAESPPDVGPAFDRALEAVRAGKPALVNVLTDREAGAMRRDPLLQMVTFNDGWFAERRSRQG